MNTLNAKLSIIKALGHPNAPRVMDPQRLSLWLNEHGVRLAPITLNVALPDLCDTGILARVRHGIYINQRSKPAVTLDEVAPWIRQTAVVSLQRVLGRHGVFNNPTDWVTCVVSSDKARKVGTVETPLGVFTFNALKDEFIAKPDDDWADDALEPFTKAPTATPEKALMDWLYLAETYRSKVIAPQAFDLDLEDLDPARLERLAKRMGLELALENLVKRVEKADDDLEQHNRRQLTKPKR